jgi:hypothetical protein
MKVSTTRHAYQSTNHMSNIKFMSVMSLISFVRWVSITLFFSALTFAHAKDDVMSTVTAESLDSVAVTFPKDLPGDPTIILIGFEFDHQVKMDEWVVKMNLKADRREWIQVHLINRFYGLISGFINSRKRPYFPDAYARARVVPIYTNIEEFLRAMGLPESTKEPYVLVVQPSGKVLHYEQGDYSIEKASAVNQSYKPSN